jgi:MraZ protein
MSKETNQTVAVSTKAASASLAGEVEHSLDPKKRLTIPSGWRAAMGNPAYVYVMPDRGGQCLNLLPPEEMDAMLAKLREKALFNPALNQAAMTLGRMSEMLPLDVQGRIRICDKLLRFANLTTTVAMLGAVRMIQLWDPAALPPANEVDQKGLGDALALAGF